MGWDETERVQCQHGVHEMRFTYNGDPIPPGDPLWQPHFGQLMHWRGGCPLCPRENIETHARLRRPRDMFPVPDED